MKATNYNKSFLVLTLLFFMWGLITILVNSLVPRLESVFELSVFEARLLQFTFFMGYGVFSIPSGFILSKIGYQRGIILGIVLMGFGCMFFYPAATHRLYPVFLLGYFILAVGMAVIQVVANPYVAVLGSERNASYRLNLSQAFNSLGTVIAPILCAIFILNEPVRTKEEIELLSESAKQAYFTIEATTVQNPFLILTILLILLAIVFSTLKLPKALPLFNKNSRNKLRYISVLKNKPLSYGAVGIFLYVGAEVAIGSYLIDYFLSMNLDSLIKNNDLMTAISELILREHIYFVDNYRIVEIFVPFYWLGAMVGRFIGAYLTKMYNPSKILAIFTILAISMVAISMLTDGFVAMGSILSVGLFNSIMFPTIFTISITGLGKLKPQASGILCTAIVGGAFIPTLYGFVSSNFGFGTALLLMICCYFYILFFAKKFYRIDY